MDFQLGWEWFEKGREESLYIKENNEDKWPVFLPDLKGINQIRLETGSCNLTDTELQSRTGWWGVIEASGGCEDTKGLWECGRMAQIFESGDS